MDNSGWEYMDRAFPHPKSFSLCRAFLLLRYQQVVLTVLPSLSQEQCLVGGATSLVSWVSMTAMVGGQNAVCENLSPQLRLTIRSFSDRSFPALLKSLRSQRVIYVSCGEDHTAALTKLSYILFGNVTGTVACGRPWFESMVTLNQSSVWLMVHQEAVFLEQLRAVVSLKPP